MTNYDLYCTNCGKPILYHDKPCPYCKEVRHIKEFQEESSILKFNGYIGNSSYFINSIIIKIISIFAGLAVITLIYLFFDMNIFKQIEFQNVIDVGTLIISPLLYFNVIKRLNDITGNQDKKFIKSLLFCILLIPYINFIFGIYLLCARGKKTLERLNSGFFLLVCLGTTFIIFFLWIIKATIMPLLLK